MSVEHVSVDGTPVKAFAISREPWRPHGAPPTKRFQPKDSASSHDEGLGGQPPQPSDEIFNGSGHQPPQTETQPMPDTPRPTRNARHAPPDTQRRGELPGRDARERSPLERRRQRRSNRRRDDGNSQRHRHAPGATRRRTLGAGKGCDNPAPADGVRGTNAPRIVSRGPSPPHVAQTARHSAIDGRTTQHPGYALSQRRRKKIDLRRQTMPVRRGDAPLAPFLARRSVFRSS